ncbi:hypothetical protein JD969_20485 [Planctomycetota bacterium]|nr:hypothetical protein JD969_20485 [Planctomycetota bacterium]
MPTATPTHSIDSLNQDDVRAIVRLLSNIAVIPTNVLEQKRTLLQGLADLIDCDYWLWSTMLFSDNKPSVGLETIHNFPEHIFTAITSSNYELTNSELKKQIIKNNKTKIHWTCRRNSLVPDSVFKNSMLYSKYIADTKLGDALFTAYPLNSNPSIISGISVHRTHDKPSFTSRDCLIMHILTSEIDWLHEINAESYDTKTHALLTPRLQTVFALLMDGITPKRIAHHLSLSENSVRAYIQLIYKHFNASSRLELTNRFTQGDGNHISI